MTDQRHETAAQKAYRERTPEGTGLGFQSSGLGVEEEYDPKELEAAIGPKPTGIAAISEWNKKRKAWLDARKPKPKPTPTPKTPATTSSFSAGDQRKALIS